MNMKKEINKKGMTALQAFADWLALGGKREEKFEVTSSETAFVIRRVKTNESTSVMQFTGLHDKNGKEIYEGDIFTFTAGKKRLTAKVIFEDAMFKMKCDDGWGAMILQKESDMEVIGNIYENPELIK